MNIQGLDYNTQRAKLILSEYGREIQQMVDHAVSLPTKAERQRCARTIIRIMDRMSTEDKTAIDHERKLWDHLALMSNFQLDIDYPYDVSQAVQIQVKPAPMDYPMQQIPVRHYGKMIFDLFERLKTMEPGAERDTLVRLTANQMRRNLLQWGHGSSDEERVASDLARFTDGRIQLDLGKFKFDKSILKEAKANNNNNNNNNKKKKK